MFAGLPGIGVGTLFYVLTALWMPFRELNELMRGRSSLARWRLISKQCSFAVSIVASVAVADRVLAMLIEGEKITSITPARLVNQVFAAKAPASLLADPFVASLLLLLGVVAFTEVLGLWVCLRAWGASERSLMASGRPGPLCGPTREFCARCCDRSTGAARGARKERP